MTGFAGPSIARRVALAVLAACAIAWFAIYLVGRQGVLQAGTGTFDRTLEVIATTTLAVIGESPGRREREIGVKALLRFAIEDQKGNQWPDGFFALRAVDDSGGVIAIHEKEPVPWPAADARLGHFDIGPGEGTHRVYRAVSADGRLRVEVAQSKAARQSLFDEVMFGPEGLRPVAVGIPVLLLPALFAVVTGLSPLRRLARELATRAPSDLSPLKESTAYREIAPVVTELNAAFARIDALLARERAFLADAAHELRTPLAVMSAQVDNLRGTTTAGDREAALARLDGGLARANRLVNQLLALARLDAEAEGAVTDVNVADLARECLAAHEGEARRRGIEVSYRGPDALPMRCPLAALESLVDNLVANAVRHGRDGGRVDVALEPAGRDAARLRE